MDRLHRLERTAMEVHNRIVNLSNQCANKGEMTKEESVILTALLNQQQMTHDLIDMERRRKEI